MIPLTNHANRIRTLHGEAQTLAAAAIDRAIEAGRLLTEVKDSLPHGEFGAWVETHCGFTGRTARRYMRVHANRESLPSGITLSKALAQLKTDTVSVIQPAWLPPIGEAVSATDCAGNMWFAWAVDGGFAHAMHLDMPPASNDWTSAVTKKPIRHDRIGDQLKAMELPDPDKADWDIWPLHRVIGLRQLLAA